MITLLPKSDTREKIIHIVASATFFIGVTVAMLLRLFEFLPHLLLFYIPVIYVTWMLVLLLAKKTKVPTALLPGIWLSTLGLIMLVISILAMIIIAPRETDMGYGFIIFITIFVPGLFVISAGFLLLLIGIGIRMLNKRKSSAS